VSFAAPQLLWLALAAPCALAAALWLLGRRARAEAAWTGRLLAARLRRGRPRPPVATALLVAAAALALALALARPRWGEATETVERRGLDLVFVLDTSLSMSAADVSPSRFWLAQSVVRRLAAALPGHRVALVAAEGEGEVMTPLTVDGAVLDLLLDALSPGSLPQPGTRLAPALERAADLFGPGSETHRVVVVVSDGEDHGGDLARPLARLREAGAVVLALGVGTAQGAPLALAGRPGEFKRDRDGEVVVSRLHPETLRRLAEATGGSYFEASSASFDPGALAAAIARRGGRKIEATTLTSLEERFQLPLALAVAALAAGLVLSPWSWRPRHEEAA